MFLARWKKPGADCNLLQHRVQAAQRPICGNLPEDVPALVNYISDYKGVNEAASQPLPTIFSNLEVGRRLAL